MVELGSRGMPPSSNDGNVIDVLGTVGWILQTEVDLTKTSNNVFNGNSEANADTALNPMYEPQRKNSDDCFANMSGFRTKREAVLWAWYANHGLLLFFMIGVFAINWYIIYYRPFDPSFNQISEYYDDTMTTVRLDHVFLPIYVTSGWILSNCVALFFYGQWILQTGNTKPHLAIFVSSTMVFALTCLFCACCFTFFELRHAPAWDSDEVILNELGFERWGLESKNLRSTNRIFGVLCIYTACMYVGLMLNGYFTNDPRIFYKYFSGVSGRATYFVKLAIFSIPFLAFLLVIVLVSKCAEYARGYGMMRSDIRVVFMGNSMLYYNDCPRFLTALSGHHIIEQNSTLKPSGTLKSLAKLGNNMSYKFHTSNALTQYGTYDIGAPTIRHLLLDKAYGHWDYAIINDRTYNPAIELYRNATCKVLKSIYAPLLEMSGVLPVIVATYAPYRDNRRQNLTIPEYTLKVMQGVEQYAEVLTTNLPQWQYAKVSPVGLAFSAVYEDNYDIWEKLFFTDELHPSPLGTYLQGCVLHCTLFGKPPPRRTAIQPQMSDLWSDARYAQRTAETNSSLAMDFPTTKEARYLYNIAVKVAC